MPKPPSPLPQPLIGQDIGGVGYVTSYPTPASDSQLAAALESNVENYLAQLYGTPPPEGQYPDKLLVNETPIDWKMVRRTYMSDRQNEDTYNLSENFSGDATAFPIFVRDYVVRRANYAPRTLGSALSGVVLATVITPGSGYTSATTAAVSGGTGSGCTLVPIISDGKVVHLAITAEGNYTVSPVLVTFTDPGGGTGATAAATVQPASAVLVKEEMIRQPDQVYDGLYVLVRRIYETLPGPWLPVTRWDDDLGQIYGRKRAEYSNPSTQVSDLAQFQEIVRYEAREGSSVVVWRFEENYSDGTGSGTGNEVYPLKTHNYSDVVRGDVQQTRQIVIATGQTSSRVLSGTTVTITTYEIYPPSKYFVFEVIESFQVPGPYRVGSEFNDACQGRIASITKQLLAVTAADYSPDYGSLEYRDEPVDAVTKDRTVVYAQDGFPTLYDYYRDPLRNNRLVTISYVVVDASTSLPADSSTSMGGVHHELRKIDYLRSLLITTTYSTPSGYTEYRFGAWTMPGLFDILVYSYSDACQAFMNTASSAYPSLAYRPADSQMTEIYTQYEWFAYASKPAQTTCFYYMPSSLQIGKGWQGWNRVLVDEYALPITCGGSSFFVDVAASDPVDWSTYCGSIVLNYQLCSEEVVLDEGLLWKRTRLYVKMK